jgi:hypothetical protein
MVDFFYAIKAVPLVNFLGMPFVLVPRSKTLFCVWQTRSKDLAPIAKKCSTLQEHRGSSARYASFGFRVVLAPTGTRLPLLIPTPSRPRPEFR